MDHKRYAESPTEVYAREKEPTAVTAYQIYQITYSGWGPEKESGMIKGLAAWVPVLMAMQAGPLLSCRGENTDVHRTALDSSIVVQGSQGISVRPTPNPRVKRFLETNQGSKERAFDELMLDDSLDAAAYMRLWHPPQGEWLKYALARFGRDDVISGLFRRLGRVDPNSDIEITLELIDETLQEFPHYKLSQGDLDKVEIAAEKLQGQLAREWAFGVLSRLRNSVGTRR